MDWTFIIALLGFVGVVTLGYTAYKKTKANEPRSLMLWSGLSFSALVMLFPSVWANIIIGLLRGAALVPEQIDVPDFSIGFSPATALIFVISSALAVVTLLKLRSEAHERGMTLSEFVMNNKPTEEQKELGKPSDLDESVRETYRATEETRSVQRDQ